MINLKQRVNQPEWMDTEVLPPATLQQTLRFLEFTNTHFGGTQVVLTHLQKWSRHWPSNNTIKILDVGTGNADIPRAILRWARAARLKVQVTAVDLNEAIVRMARDGSVGFETELELRQADFMDLIPKKERFDYVIASLLLHHIPPEQAVSVLKAMDQMAARGLLISDLLRSQKSYWAVTMASALFGNAVVRHDGPLSVRRAFRVEELQGLAEKANLPYLQARREPWFRVSLTGEKPYAF